MPLPAWWQVVTPHKDIKEKSFTEAVFAADLGDVLNGTAPEEYCDPRLFFAKTYLTAGLKNLARNVLERLTSGRGDPVIQLQTPFGGGKTHSLITLYHLVKSFSEIDHLEQVKELASGAAGFAGVRVAAFVGTSADPVKGRTPWGEIAYQLGFYEVVRDHDVRRVAPGKERIKEIFQKSGPALILIDELLEYIVKANRVEKVERITQGQTLAFLQELSESVAASEKTALVLTLPASILEHYDEEAEKALAQLQKVSGRVESIYVPVEGMEVYEVIRKRLFEDPGDQKVHRLVAEEYLKLYQGLGTEVPGEVRETAFREKVERAYPFHPEFIDVLYERWGSYPTFQRTRGVLRLLAQVVGELYERKVVSPLIQSSLVNLSSLPIRREFVKHIGNEYDSVINSDVTGKAVRIDQEIGSEYEKYGIARGLATAVFLYSFSGAQRRGVTLPWLRVALLREGVPPTIVGDAVNKLEESLWFFHAEKHVYSFKNQPNLNKVITDREETIEEGQIREAFAENLAKLTKEGPFEVYLWPREASGVPDNRRLKLVVFDPDLKEGAPETKAFAKELLEKAGATFRIYRNVVFALAVDQDAYAGLKGKLRRHLALKDIAKDASLVLAPASREELQTKLKQAEKDIPFQVINAYRHVGWSGNGGVAWRDMGLPPAGEGSLTGRVFRCLKDEKPILSSITPKLILEKGMGQDEEEKSIREIYDIFLKTPGFPCLESEDVLLKAAREGAEKGVFGVRTGDRLFFREPLLDPDPESLVVRPEKAAEEKKSFSGRPEERGKTPPGGTEKGEEKPGPEPDGSPGGEKEKRPRKVAIKASVPWDKLSSIVTGVIRPLKTSGAEPEITIEIKAEATGGFDRTTLDSKVKETLTQLGAKVMQWEEE
ncbi:predicted ATPase [Pelotomaculum thermopropionicum SI]|uniref:Predicted ATPase n=1 Tax=Pelotomaculum thermopropionicum (strain DSM 13744 / JCM 10971 / SI) TaxID=370438 RepID=A5D401_PELTS|nr:predicted ATPase [Pelotomaculum thermopropionicum SI]